MSSDKMPETHFEADAPVRELTFGEKAVGIRFNPGRSGTVEEIKDVFAEAIDIINKLKVASESPEVKRMYSVAITDAQTAQMWAVKAATWQY